MPDASHPSVKILHTGNWSASEVSQAWTPNARRIEPAVEQAIESAWTVALARAGVHLFDGPMCRLESWHATESRLRLVLSKSTYKTFLGTNMSNPEFAETFGPDVMANPVGVSPALLTADHKLLLGRRTQSVAYYPGRIHPFSGCLEPGDDDLFSAVARELKEELSLESPDIADIRCIGIAEDQSLRQQELIFAVRSPRSRAEIESRLDPAEHESICAIDATGDAIEKIIREEKGLIPRRGRIAAALGPIKFRRALVRRNR